MSRQSVIKIFGMVLMAGLLLYFFLTIPMFKSYVAYRLAIENKILRPFFDLEHLDYSRIYWENYLLFNNEETDILRFLAHNRHERGDFGTAIFFYQKMLAAGVQFSALEYFDIADCYFRLHDHNRGKQYLKTGFGVMKEIPQFGMLRSRDELSYGLIGEEIRRSYGDIQTTSDYQLHEISEVETKSVIGLRKYIYMIKCKDLLLKTITKQYGSKAEEKYSDFLTVNDPRFKEIIEEECRKDFCEIDIIKHFISCKDSQ